MCLAMTKGLIDAFAEFFSEPDKALGRVGGELDILARDRVDETELIGVQTLTAERGDDL